MRIYLDNTYKCYITNNGKMKEIETDFFNGKCAEYIEGYRYIPDGETWTREDGIIFTGEMIAPFIDYSTLDAAQREYERQQIAEMKEALALLGVNEYE